MPNDVGILTYLFSQIVSALSGGYLNIAPNAMWLLYTLVRIEVVVICLWWAFGKMDVPTLILKKIVLLSILFWLLTMYPRVLFILQDTMVTWGLTLGGNAFTPADLQNPSRIAAAGLTVTKPIWQQISSLSWYSWGSMLELEFAGIVIIISYFVLAIQLFLTLVEFWLISFASLILIPFGAFNSTAWLAEGVLKTILGLCVKLLVLSTIISIGVPLIEMMSIPNPPTLHDCFGVILASLTLAFLAWQAPAMAMGMISGRPSLTAGTAAGTAAGAAFAASKAGRGAISTASGARSMGSRALRGGKAATNVAQQSVNSMTNIAKNFSNRTK